MKDNSPKNIIKKNRRANRIYNEALQLKSYSHEVNRFILNSVKNVGLSKDLVNWFEIIYNLVKKTEQFPQDAVYKIQKKNALVELNANGEIVKVNKDELQVLAGYPELKKIESRDDIKLNGLADIDEKPFSSFLKAHIEGRLNRLTFDAFMKAGESAYDRWQIKKLRTFFADYGNDKWIPPLDDFNQLEKIIDQMVNPDLYIEQILKTMANAGKMGFCPTQYLRKVIIPQLKNNINNWHVFKKITSISGECFKFIKNGLGKEGDGSASNLFTIKYFIKPITTPASRLFNENYYKNGIKDIEKIFYSMASRWTELFSRGYAYTRDLIRFYADVYIEGICRIEIPQEIELQVNKMIGHIEKIASIINNRNQYRRFLKTLHTRGVKLLLKEVENKGRSANFLKIMQKHFNLVEKYARENFSINYRRYLSIWSRGLIQRPEDIDSFIQVCNSVDTFRYDDVNEIIDTILHVTKTEEARNDLLYFLKNCPVFDKDIFFFWVKQEEQIRVQVMEELKSLYGEYLVNPVIKTRLLSSADFEEKLEHALVKQHVKSSKLNKRDIDVVLGRRIITGKEPVLKELHEPACFLVKNKKSEIFSKVRVDIKSKNMDFFANKYCVLDELYEYMGDPDYRKRLIRSLLELGVKNYEKTRQMIMQSKDQIEKLKGKVKSEQDKIEQQLTRLAKKHKGLKQQLKIPQYFMKILLLARNYQDNLRSLCNELAINYLMQDKKFAKNHSSLYAKLVLSDIIKEENEQLLLSEPFSIVYNHDSDPLHFSLRQISALKEIFSTIARNYFVTLYTEKLPLLAVNIKLSLYEYYKDLGFNYSLESNSHLSYLADYCYHLFSANQSYKLFNQEIKRLESNIDDLYGEKQRKIIVVGAKRKIDQFFAHVGEICIAEFYKEVKRRDFTPLRIIDKDNNSLIGYIHFFLLDYTFTQQKHKVVVIGGMEPKTSWLAYIDEIDFYQGLRSLLIKKAQALKAGLLCIPTANVAHSNSNSIAELIAIDLMGKPVIKIGYPFTFPKGVYDLSTLVVLWSDGRIKLVEDMVRY